MQNRNGNGTIKTFVVGSHAFVPTDRTGINGAVLYVKTHAAVGLVDCSCGAKKGELCRGDRGPTVTCHMDRRGRVRRLIPRTDNVFVFDTPVKVV